MDYKNSGNGSPSSGNYWKGNEQSDAHSNCQLHLSELPHHYTKEHLLGLFKNYVVTNARVITKPDYTFGFITLESPEEAKRVIKEMNRVEVEEGRCIKIRFAMSQLQSRSYDGGQRQYYSEGRRTTNWPRNGDGYRPGAPRAQSSHNQTDNCDDDDDMPPLAPLHPVVPAQNGVRPTTTEDAIGYERGAHYTGAVCTNENPDDYSEVPSLAPLSLSAFNKQDAVPSVTSSAGSSLGFHRTRDEDQNKYSVIVSNSPEGASEFEVMQIFSQYYPRQCLMILDKPEPRYKQGTLALVYFGDENHAALAASHLDGSVHCGRTIRVWHLV